VAPRVCLTVQRSVNADTVSHPVQCVFKTAVLIPNPAKGEIRLLVSSTLSFLARYEEKGDDFVGCIVTGDGNVGASPYT
jgi:hypothetical protein